MVRPVLSLLAVFILLLASCGGSGDERVGGGSPEPTVAGETEERDTNAGSDPSESNGVTGDLAEAAAEALEGAEVDGAAGTSVAASDEPASGESSGGASASTVPVTIEPPPAAPNVIPAATTGCEGAGFGETLQGSPTTRIGVLVPDYGALIETGFVPRVTPIEYRTRYLASTYGANVRHDASFPGSPFALPCGELEIVLETYDPLDPATQRDACIAFADGPGVLVVLSELEDRRGEGLSCLIDEAGIPVVTAGSVTAADLAGADGQLVSLRPPIDLLAEAAVQAFADLQLLDGQSVGVLGGDDEISEAATQVVLDELANLDVEAVSVVVPSGTGVTDVWAELPEVVDEFVAEEVTVVISMFDAVVNNALWDRMIKEGVTWQFLLVDATGVAEHDKVTRLPDEFSGMVFTSLDSHKEADRTGPASVECISDYAAVVSLLETNPESSGLLSDQPAFSLPASAPGDDDESPATTIALEPTEEPVTEEGAAEGSLEEDTLEEATLEEDSAEEDSLADEGPLEDADDGIETALREQLGEDRPPGPACALATTVIRAILAAGEDLTASTLMDELHRLGPTELFIEGSGSLSPGKNYLADFGQVFRFERYVEPISDELAAPCDSPDNCWRELEDLAGAKRPLPN